MISNKIIDQSLSKIIQDRRSTRVFTNKIPDQEVIMSLFEAARWAPSSANNQPWRYIYATQNEEEKFQKVLSCLAEGNKIWAVKAPLLILSVAKKLTNTGKPYRHNLYDTGAANLSIALQAIALGLQAHIMGGFDVEMAKSTFNISDDYEPVVIIAVGYPGDINSLPENLKARELNRERFDIETLLLK